MDIRYGASALGHLEELEQKTSKRILNKMRFFARQQDPLSFAKHLTGFEAHRFRVGDYRVICEVHGETLYVLAVLKRDDAYRDL